MRKVIGDRLIYVTDGSMVEITCLSEYDGDGRRVVRDIANTAGGAQ